MAALAAADLLLRGGVCLLLALTAALLMRDYRGAGAARLGAAFAAGTAAFALCSSPGLHAALGWWAAPVTVLASGNNLVFWLFARALFDDGFRLRRWHGGLWAATVGLGLLAAFRPSSLLGALLAAEALGFAALAAGQALASWRVDLVEGRRRLRQFVVGASAAYIAVTTLGHLAGAREAAPEAASVVEAAGLAAIAVAIAWSLLRVAGDGLFQATAQPRLAAAIPLPPAPEPVDRVLLAALERAMAAERAYRTEGLTIGALAERLSVQEYRLRRAINQGLGHRNFNSFLNSHRIGEAKEALADPAQARVPVLTIALDSGFSSLGPFNRAFKAETGMTPTEYRRIAAGRLADSEIGAPIPVPAGDRSDPARNAAARAR